MHPEPDKQYRDHKVTKVEPSEGGGWFMTMDDGWSFFCQADSPVEPKLGMTARMYGKGIGFPVRGLFLDDQKVYYFTEGEYTEKQEIERYGASPAAWLEKWDGGDTCWTVELGGLGPGYEQAIQITVAEILRHLIYAKYDHAAWKDEAKWKADREAIEQWSFADPIIKGLGLSGEQWGAAFSLSRHLYMKGPRVVLTDPRIKDRLIQVSKHFPQAAAA